MRLFTAVELPDEVRAAVAAAARPLLAAMHGVRSVAPENLHVTVRFLGEVAEPRLAELRPALAAAALATPAGPARIAGFGAFPSPRAPRVIWAGVEEPQRTISALEREVSARVAPLGFPAENRPYAPHVTIARIDTRRGRPRPFVPPAPSPLGSDFAVSALTLFVSELSPRGPQYRVLDRFPLATP